MQLVRFEAGGGKFEHLGGLDVEPCSLQSHLVLVSLKTSNRPPVYKISHLELESSLAIELSCSPVSWTKLQTQQRDFQLERTYQGSFWVMEIFARIDKMKMH